MGYIDGKGVAHEDNMMPASITPGDPQNETGDISDMAARMGENPDTLTPNTPQDTPADNHADNTPKHGQHHPQWPWITAGSILAIGLLAACTGLGYGLWDANQQTNQQAAQACALSVTATHDATKQWSEEHRKLQNLMTGKTASMLQNPDVLTQAANLLEQQPPAATACGTTADTSQTALKQNLSTIATIYQATARLQTMSRQVSDELAMKQGATLATTRNNLINQTNQAASLAAQAAGKVEQTQPLATLNTDITAARKQAADPASSLQDLQAMSRKLTVDTQTVASDMAAYAKTQAALTQAKQEATQKTSKTANPTTTAGRTAGGAQPQTDDQDPGSTRNAANSFTPGQPIAQNEDPE